MSIVAAIHHKRSSLGRTAIAIAIAVGATSLLTFADPVAARDDDSGACTNTTLSARKACGFDADSTYWLAVGTCQNQPNATRRQLCITAAGKERDDTGALCGAQLEARDDVCDDVGQAAYDPTINPANFVKGITNRYFPLKRGTTLIYQGETDAGTERAVLRVQHQTATILGVECTQVRDTVTLDGVVTEDTLDWYAQDKQGNVWYFGESTQELEDGRPVSLEGSWRGGVDGAKPGIIMKAHPAVGDVYRQEFLLGSAEDLAEVLSLAGSATASAASCRGNCVVTHEFTPVEPTLNERKYYAPNVGFILEVDVATGNRLELIDLRRP
jgi:hypothetical protein